MDKKLFEALKRIINPKDEREALRGISYLDGSAYVSDSWALVIVKTTYNDAYEGKIIDPQGVEINSRMIKFRDVFPESIFQELSDAERIPYSPEIKTACLNLSKIKDTPEYLKLNESVFNPGLLKKVLMVFEALKEVPEIIPDPDRSRTRTYFKSEHCDAIIMEVVNHKNYQLVLSLEEALTCGDLL